MCKMTWFFQGAKEPVIPILKVCVPLLANKAPPGWTISLVDNPGFGEAKEHVTQLAEASVVTSSAYIYLMQAADIGGKEFDEFFRNLNDNDRGTYLKVTIVSGYLI